MLSVGMECEVFMQFETQQICVYGRKECQWVRDIKSVFMRLNTVS